MTEKVFLTRLVLAITSLFLWGGLMLPLSRQ